MMDYLLADDRIVFLYKLKDGRAEQSFGLNVAKVVKIPDSIITKAGKRARLMEEEITRKDKLKKLKEAIAFSSEL
jgi:DNA mismatch repair ATPase MutS